MDRLLNEIDVMRKCRHQNLVRYYMFNQFKAMGMKILDVIIELCDGTLDDFLQNPSRFNDEITKDSIMLDSANGLDYLHTAKIIHKDLKGVKYIFDMIYI